MVTKSKLSGYELYIRIIINQERGVLNTGHFSLPPFGMTFNYIILYVYSSPVHPSHLPSLLLHSSSPFLSSPLRLRRWSDNSSWTNGQPPRAGDDVTILPQWHMLVDVTPPPLGRVFVRGELQFEDGRDYNFTADLVIHCCSSLVPRPHPQMGKGLVTFKRFLGCAVSAVM